MAGSVPLGPGTADALPRDPGPTGGRVLPWCLLPRAPASAAPTGLRGQGPEARAASPGAGVGWPMARPYLSGWPSGPGRAERGDREEHRMAEACREGTGGPLRADEGPTSARGSVTAGWSWGRGSRIQGGACRPQAGTVTPCPADALPTRSSPPTEDTGMPGWGGNGCGRSDQGQPQKLRLGPRPQGHPHSSPGPMDSPSNPTTSWPRFSWIDWAAPTGQREPGLSLGQTWVLTQPRPRPRTLSEPPFLSARERGRRTPTRKCWETPLGRGSQGRGPRRAVR